MNPIGTRRDIVETLRLFNTAPETPGASVFYGPGIRVELPAATDPVTHLLVTLTEEEVGWDLVRDIVNRTHWQVRAQHA